MAAVPKEYGYVIATGCASAIFVAALGLKVGRARKQYGIPYPTMYTDNNMFNCIQRAHQNTLEHYPSYLFLLCTGGLEFPRFVSAMGVLWILGRIAFAKGYYTGNPDNRKWGGFVHIAVLGLLGASVGCALKKLEII